jgi:hypothetical protein
VSPSVHDITCFITVTLQCITCLYFINIDLNYCSCNCICCSCNCNCICIVFIVCSVSFIVCVVLCAVVMFERGVLFCVMCVICVLCLIVVPLSPGKSPFAVKINNFQI